MAMLRASWAPSVGQVGMDIEGKDDEDMPLAKVAGEDDRSQSAVGRAKPFSSENSRV